MQYMNKLINKYSAKLDSESLDAAWLHMCIRSATQDANVAALTC